MRVVDVRDIPDNAILARTVSNDSGVVLLYAGSEITEDIIKKLIDNNIHTVWISVKNKEADTFSAEAIESDVLECVTHALKTRIRFNDDTEMKLVSEHAFKTIRKIISNKDIMNCMVNVKRRSIDIYSHMINVAILSVVMGIKMDLSEEELDDIGLGALFHDIGMCDIEIEYNNIEIDKASSQDKMLYRRHVIEGYEMIHNHEWIPDKVKLIVLSHHEREDGSGYPFHKKSERIPIEVKIVAICDYFDELVNGIGYVRRKVHEVVEYIRTVGAYLFDYDVVTKIISNIAWFPNGCHVLTSDGDIAEVVSQNKGLPDRPIIRLLQDSMGNPYKENITKDLTEFLTVFIMDTVE